jgi:hypothetical protein
VREHLHGRHALQHTEIDDHDDADENLEEQNEFALLDQVCLAGFVDQL